MRLYALILFCGLLTIISADPDPKKYKSEVKEKKQSNTTLTADEKKFLRDVEAKFGIQNESPKEEKKTKEETATEKLKLPPPGHFPAVIAIEIVNDTDTKTKGKRTIDANLGYGYKTNNGYTYSYFGKPAQEKGKFMIYPYSQEDIPAGNAQTYHTVHHYEKPNGKHVKTSVEIQPSQAFELVPVKDEKPAYHYDKPAVEFKTPSHSSSSGHGHGSTSYSSHPSTLYTTYNGEQFSGLSGQFPTVMPNYLVDPTQLIKNPDYQNVGLTQDHLRSSHIEQKVVPVLVLRIPSSSLTNPTAELYANLPHNYPLSNYLNSLNLQELVNQYFKKIGYNFAPQVMTYSSPLSSEAVGSSAGSSVSQYEPQHYAHPYVQPSYTQSHSSGVQYSAVQPVMARYPSSYLRHHYSAPKGHTLYKQPSLPQKYEYQYQYVPQSAVSSQKFYIPSSHYQQHTEHVSSEEVQSAHAALDHSAGAHDTGAQVQYEVPAHVTSGYETSVSHDAHAYTSSQAHAGAEYSAPQVHAETEYAAPQAHAEVQYETHSAAPEYTVPKDGNSQSLPAGYEASVSPAPSHYESPKDSHVISQEYYVQNNQPAQQDAHYVSQVAQSHITQEDVSGHQNYVYQQQQDDSDDQGLVLSENYPSKDHTIATVLPTHYKTGKQSSGMVQSVSYVTPMPHSKYQMPYKVMVPQTYLHNPTTEKVSYVHSHPLSATYSQSVVHQDYNPEAEYTLGYHYVPPVGKQKPPSYPRNYHSHPKRMINKNEKPDSISSFSKNKSERNEKKRLS
ncbi:uncharacterized protein LOC142977153 [Anticarsia gemmatalis]|uniref:uncharacterized protein LOC142977153 n=1 Tax=Anticarsia gemmatalis TaxID=129554 RepID=UPI003F777531